MYQLIFINQIDDYKPRGDYCSAKLHVSENLNDLKLIFINWFNEMIDNYEYYFKIDERFCFTKDPEQEVHKIYHLKTDESFLNDKEYLTFVNELFTRFNKGEYSTYKFVVQFFKIEEGKVDELSVNEIPGLE